MKDNKHVQALSNHNIVEQQQQDNNSTFNNKDIDTHIL